LENGFSLVRTVWFSFRHSVQSSAVAECFALAHPYETAAMSSSQPLESVEKLLSDHLPEKELKEVLRIFYGKILE